MNKNLPKVSVIIPVYNQEKYLQQCLDSVLNQTLQDIEVICIDAGSDDASPEILADYACKDGRLSVISAGRKDAGAARNIGLAQASGEFLSFLDSDDFFRPDMLEKCYCKAVKENADIVIFRAEEFNMRQGKTKVMPYSLRMDYCPRNLTFAPQEMSKYLFNAFQNWTWNKLFRKSLIDQYSITFQEVARTNDMAFTCHALVCAEKITVIDKVFATYRTGTGTSLQQTNDARPDSFWQAYKETKHRLEKEGLYAAYRQTLKNTVLSGLLYNFDSVKTPQAKGIILDIIKTESDKEFDLVSPGKMYYHNFLNYGKYLNLLSGEFSTETEQPGENKSKLSGVKVLIKTVLNSMAFQYAKRFLIRNSKTQDK